MRRAGATSAAGHANKPPAPLFSTRSWDVSRATAVNVGLSCLSPLALSTTPHHSYCHCCSRPSDVVALSVGLCVRQAAGKRAAGKRQRPRAVVPCISASFVNLTAYSTLCARPRLHYRLFLTLCPAGY